MICDNCRNEGICKYKDEAKQVWNDLFGAEGPRFKERSLTGPIEVKVECRKFEKKAERQDGITYRNSSML